MLNGPANQDEVGRKEMKSNDLLQGDEDMTDKAEYPRIARARLSGPKPITKHATVAEIAADGTMTIIRGS